MKYEKSCGAIVMCKFNEKYKVLLIQHVNGGHWSFPKGHVENSESETETALREIKEETGLDVKIDTGFHHVTTYSPGEGITKDVVYFLARAISSSVVPQVEEVQNTGWYSYEEAKKKITYENDRKLLESAITYLIS